MENGVILDTDKAKQRWSEETRWDGNNHISVNTGSQWDHETLFCSSKGTYYIEFWSQWQGSTPACRYVSDEDAATWLLHNDHELPEDLKKFEDAIVE